MLDGRRLFLVHSFKLLLTEVSDVGVIHLREALILDT